MPFALARFDALKQHVEEPDALQESLAPDLWLFDRHRHDDAGMAAGEGANVLQHRSWLADMFEHLGTDDQIEFAARKRQWLLGIELVELDGFAPRFEGTFG